jgi:hypothetical protein
MAPDVFVSHAHKDKKIADAICERLESVGVRCWLTARDISAGEDWTKATRKAIGSSRLMLLVLSENAKAAPHIEREIAHAFYTKRIILPVRLTQTPPPREFLFYLGDVRWFDVFGAPAEQRLEALAATINGMVHSRIDPRDVMPSPRVTKTVTTSGFSNSWIEARWPPHNRTLKIVKSAAIGTCLFAVAALFAFWPWRTEHEDSLEAGNLHPMHSVLGASADSSPQATGDAAVTNPRYTYTRLGLWAASKTDPTPPVQPAPHETPSSTTGTQAASATPWSMSDHQKPVGDGESLGALDTASVRSVQENTTGMGNRRQVRQRKSHSKSHNGRVNKSQGLRFADIKSRLRTLWRQIVARSK